MNLRAYASQKLLLVLAVLWSATALSQTNVIFKDASLEASIRLELDKPTGPLSTADMLLLTNLNVYRPPPVTNLSGLEAATNLEWLSLGWNKVSDLIPLAALRHLKVLYLDYNPITNCEALQSLTNLSYLSISGTPLKDIACLSALQNLQELYLYGGQATNYAPLAALTKLNRLNIGGAPLPNCGSIAGLTHLTELDLFDSGLTNVNCLAGLTNLTRLMLGDNQIADVNPLWALSGLQNLFLGGNPLNHCGGLASLTNFTGYLHINQAAITNLAGLTNLHLMSELDLSQNPITDLSPLSRLTNLVTLSLNNTGTNAYGLLAALTNLTSLELTGNSLSRLDSLPALPKLTFLDLSFNHLANLDGIAAFPKIASFYARYNHLTNINPLVSLPSPPWPGGFYLQGNLLDLSPGSQATNVIHTLLSRGDYVTFLPQNQPPVFSIQTNWVVPANEPSSMHIFVGDDVTSANALVITATSGNTNLLSVVIGTNNSAAFPVFPGVIELPINVPGNYNPLWQGYLNVVPGTNQTGTTTIVLTATDDTRLSTQRVISVTVLPVAPFGSQLNSNLVWRTFGASPWSLQTNVTHNGGIAAQAGSPESWLEAQVNGPGLLTFWWKSAVTNGEYYYGKVDAQGPAGLRGSAVLYSGDWQQQRLSIPAGSWLFRWHPTPEFGSEMFWLDDVSFQAGPAPCWLEASPWLVPGYFYLRAHGAPGQTYDLEASTNLQQWIRLDRFTLFDFLNSSGDTNAPPAGRFYRLKSATIAPMTFDKPRLTNGVLQLTLNSERGQPLQVESSTDLINWTTWLVTNNVSGNLHLTQPTTPTSPARFYRKALPWGPAGGPGQPGPGL